MREQADLSQAIGVVSPVLALACVIGGAALWRTRAEPGSGEERSICGDATGLAAGAGTRSRGGGPSR